MWETWVWSLGWEDPLEKGKATHSSTLAWRIPWTVESMGSQRAGLGDFLLYNVTLVSAVQCESAVIIHILIFQEKSIKQAPTPSSSKHTQHGYSQDTPEKLPKAKSAPSFHQQWKEGNRGCHQTEGDKKGTRVRTVWFPDVALASSSVQHSHSLVSPQNSAGSGFHRGPSIQQWCENQVQANLLVSTRG